MEALQITEKDVERGSIAVDSVLSLCRILSDDSDFCSQRERGVFRLARENLSKRWDNIVQLLEQKKSSLEETWSMWLTFFESTQSLDLWLDGIELQMADMSESQPSETTLKSVKEYQKLQHEIDKKLCNVTALNELYRKMTREGRCDVAGEIKNKVQQVSDRYEALARKAGLVAAPMTTRAKQYKQLEADMIIIQTLLNKFRERIINVEHNTSETVTKRLADLKILKKEFDGITARIEALNQSVEDVSRSSDQTPTSLRRLRKSRTKLQEHHRDVEIRLRRLREKILSSSHTKQKKLSNASRSSSISNSESMSSQDSLQDVEELYHDDRFDDFDGSFAIHQDSDDSWFRAYEHRDKQPTDDVLFQQLEATMEDLDLNIEAATALQDPVSDLHKCHASVLKMKAIADKIRKKTVIPLQIEKEMNELERRSVLLQYRLSQLASISIQRLDSVSSPLTSEISDHDLWLNDTEAIQATYNISDLGDMRFLERAIRRHKELKLQLDIRRQLLVASGRRHVLDDTTTPEGQLVELGDRYEAVFQCEDAWERELQMALVNCSEFSQTVQHFQTWLDCVQEELTSVQHEDDASICDNYLKLKEIEDELMSASPRVSLLQETAENLLQTSDSLEGSEAINSLDSISSRLHVLLNDCISKLASLQMRQAHSGIFPIQSVDAGTVSYTAQKSRTYKIVDDTDDDTTETTDPCLGRCKLFGRVCRLAIPLQLLMLLLLGAAWLVPLAQEDLDCRFANTLRRSVHPMLTQTHGTHPF